MLLGKNTNVRHQGVVFHVQTEDSGRARPHVITHLYHQGTILASEKRSYAELARRSDLEERVRELMDEQHERMLGKLRRGELDGMLRERLGSGFAGGSDTQPSGRPEPTLPRREETIPAPTPTPAPAARAHATRPIPSPAARPAAASAPRPAAGSVQRARIDASRETTLPEPTPRTFGDGIITDKPLDEVILAYLVEKARHRKRLPT